MDCVEWWERSKKNMTMEGGAALTRVVRQSVFVALHILHLQKHQLLQLLSLSLAMWKDHEVFVSVVFVV